jgi:hypothetical protein
MKYDADEEIEEDGEQILQTGTICLQNVGFGGLAVLERDK